MATLDAHADALNWAMIGGKPAEVSRLGLKVERYSDDPCDDQESPHPHHGDQMEAISEPRDDPMESDPSPADSAHNGHAYYRAADEAVPTLE